MKSVITIRAICALLYKFSIRKEAYSVPVAVTPLQLATWEKYRTAGDSVTPVRMVSS